MIHETIATQIHTLQMLFMNLPDETITNSAASEFKHKLITSIRSVNNSLFAAVDIKNLLCFALNLVH